MRYVICGLGNIGHKRKAALADRCVATVDPINPEADYRDLREVALTAYDAAIIATPTAEKEALMGYLFEHGTPVLVEKPMLVENTLLKFGHACWHTGYNFRFEPTIVRAAAAIASGAIGEVYHGRLILGTGTAANVKGTWRDHATGTLEETCCHLLDLVNMFTGERPAFDITAMRPHETASPDHATLDSDDDCWHLDGSWLAWKNTFTIAVYGSAGSVHVDGLRKWEGSRFTLRKRVFPSGKPEEVTEYDSGPDLTWAADIAHFEQMVLDGRNDAENDRWIAGIIGQ